MNIFGFLTVAQTRHLRTSAWTGIGMDIYRYFVLVLCVSFRNKMIELFCQKSADLLIIKILVEHQKMFFKNVLSIEE